MKEQESGVSTKNERRSDAGAAVSAPERHSPLEMDAGTFRALGYRLIDQVAAFLESVPNRPVTTDQSPSAVRDALGLGGSLRADSTSRTALEVALRATTAAGLTPVSSG